MLCSFGLILVIRCKKDKEQDLCVEICLPHSTPSHFIKQSNMSVNNCAYPVEKFVHACTKFCEMSVNICESFFFKIHSK